MSEMEARHYTANIRPPPTLGETGEKTNRKWLVFLNGGGMIPRTKRLLSPP